MQKKRNTILALSLLALTLTSLSLFFLTREEPLADIDHDIFKVNETAQIDRVELQSPKAKVDLTFENNRWRVNGKWDADLDMIKVLFATLKQVEPRRPVASSLLDSVMKRLADSGIRVMLSSGGVVQMRFLAGGNPAKTEAWFWKYEDAGEEVYSMRIPGYRVYVSGIFELDEGGWRNKRIFDFNWRNLKSVSASYPKEPAQGFQVEMKDKFFGIRELPNADTTKLNDYLDDVSLLFAARFVSSEDQAADSLKGVGPAARIEILDVADRKYSLEIFTPGKNDGEVYGRMGDSQVVRLYRSDVQSIVRRKDYFKAPKSNP